MNTPNKLSLLRVALIPVMVLFMYLPGWPMVLLSAAVFGAAAYTDYLDGHIARRDGIVTDFGKFMDPLADKLLVMSAMAWFVEVGWMPGWAFFIVLAREFAVTGLRLVAVGNGTVIAAGWSGKVKTASTMVGLCVLMAFRIARTETPTSANTASHILAMPRAPRSRQASLTPVSCSMARRTLWV